MALLHARACALYEPEALRQALAKEEEPALAALMRRLLPGHDPMLRQEAEAGLFHSCPVVRHLSASWLSRLPERPRSVLEAALARERDPLLKEGLQRLLAGQPMVQTREQIWWQDSAP